MVLALAGASAAQGRTMTVTTKTFVLVHGAWHGGWCWRRVADRLTAKGCKVFAPTLTGLGERAHLLDERTSLATHIADIVNTIKWEGLADIVLVGHSYGGFVISGVAEQLWPSIASLVFLDAFVPENGQSMADLTSQRIRDLIAAAAQTGSLTVEPFPAALFRVNEKDRAWVDALCTPQPRAAMTEKATVTGARDRVSRKTYIRARDYPSAAFDGHKAALAQNPGWRVYELPCGHDAMIDMPAEVADLLLASA